MRWPSVGQASRLPRSVARYLTESRRPILMRSSRIIRTGRTPVLLCARSNSTTAAAFSIRLPSPGDYVAIADRVRAFERVIVECHPALVGESALEFRDLLNAVDASEASPPVHRPTPGPFQEGNSVEPLAGRLPSSHGDAGRFAGPISHPSSM